MFSVILPGRPCLTEFTNVDPTKFALQFPSAPHFSHIVIFLLPGQVLPPDAAAAVYIQFPNQTDFKLLGAIGNEKPSAIFRVRMPESLAQSPGLISLGISIEPQSTIAAQLATLESSDPSLSSESTALVKRPPSTKVLAQRIIQNAFNFLASFAGNVQNAGPNGQAIEVVPLKSFQDWWTKFERRVEMDPGFLEREVN